MENTKGQNTNKDTFHRSSVDDNEQGKTYRRTHGTVDMDPQESIASTNRQTRGSGLTTKRNVTGSDYDGQNAGE
jgi:hypothetical protein